MKFNNLDKVRNEGLKYFWLNKFNIEFALKARHVRNNSLPSVVLIPSPKIDLSCESRKAAYRRQIPESLKSIPIHSKFILDSCKYNLFV